MLSQKGVLKANGPIVQFVCANFRKPEFNKIRNYPSSSSSSSFDEFFLALLSSIVSLAMFCPVSTCSFSWPTLLSLSDSVPSRAILCKLVFDFEGDKSCLGVLFILSDKERSKRLLRAGDEKTS